MKNNCDTIKDLLPLYVDGVASDASKEMILEHLKECPSCCAFLDSLNSRLSENKKELEREKATFSQVASHMKRRRLIKRVLLVVLILIVIAAAWPIGVRLYYRFVVDPQNSYTSAMNSTDFSATLSTLSDGQTVISLRTYTLMPRSMVLTESQTSTGGRTLHIDLMGYTRRQGNARAQTVVGFLPFLDNYETVTYGSDAALLWEKGQDMTPASEEMEAYQAAKEALQGCLDEILSAHKKTSIYQLERDELSTDELTRWLQLYNDAQKAQQSVPEWYGDIVEELPSPDDILSWG